jgi:hypothetical protein
MSANGRARSIKLSSDEAEDAISSFQSIIRYPTVSSIAASDGSYESCASYLLSRLRGVPCLDGICVLDESIPKCPVVVARWEGANRDWPVIVLNSHYDVVPANVEDWTVDPFGAVRRDGKVRMFVYLPLPPSCIIFCSFRHFRHCIALHVSYYLCSFPPTPFRNKRTPDIRQGSAGHEVRVRAVHRGDTQTPFDRSFVPSDAHDISDIRPRRGGEFLKLLWRSVLCLCFFFGGVTTTIST